MNWLARLLRWAAPGARYVRIYRCNRCDNVITTYGTGKIYTVCLHVRAVTSLTGRATSCGGRLVEVLHGAVWPTPGDRP